MEAIGAINKLKQGFNGAIGCETLGSSEAIDSSRNQAATGRETTGTGIKQADGLGS